MAIQIRRGTDSGWESNNSNIVAGEPAITTDTGRFFVGTDTGEFVEMVNIDTIAEAFDSSATYAVGDYCTYQGKLYKFTSAHSGAWSGNDAEEVTIADNLGGEAVAMIGDLSNLTTTAKSDVVSAINEVDGEVDSLITVTEEVDFQSFETRQTTTAGTSFKAFATRYSYSGTFKKIVVYGAYSGSGDTSTVTAQIYNANFTEVIASVTKTIGHTPEYQGVEFIFNEPVTLNGDFYIAVTSSDYLRIKNVVSTECTANSTYVNKFKYASSTSWQNMGTQSVPATSYCLDVVLYSYSAEYLTKPKTIVYIGNEPKCDYATVQEALNAITDDSENKQYVFYILAGTYEPFSMVYSDSARTVAFGRVRYISLIGADKTRVKFFDDRGNYKFSPCEIWTNGTIENISFITKTDAEHYDPASTNYAYAVHSDFGTCITEYRNCYFYSNAGPSAGCGTWHDEYLSFVDCVFENDTDGTYGASSLGAFYCHTQTTAPDNIRTNQNLLLDSCTAIMNKKPDAMKLSVVSGYTGGTYFYTLRNSGFFGKSSGHMVPHVNIVDPNNELFTEMCFNNIPSTLNTIPS